jgi:hypothetical protein
MKTVIELANYIRFQLSQLRSQNKHHDFEHLARHFARLRICENILPATGPVSSGGDQGRDFETYRSYLSSTPIATSTFLGSAKDKKIVFACSLQQDIVPKIKSDISTICASPQRIDAIYYFCEVDLPVAGRHQLQEWTRETFQSELEVFDGQALSEQLTDINVFWIAEEYLDVPSDLYPRSKYPGKTYKEYKQRWLTQDERPYSYSDFFQIKYGLRCATFEKEAKPDILKWLNKIAVYLDHPISKDLRRRAAYEICVANLRGLNNLTEKKKLIEEYFSQIQNLKNLSDIQDATTLLIYCSSAYTYKHFVIEVDKLFHWSKSLINRIEQALEDATGSGTRCRLLQIRGQACYLQFRNGTIPEINLDQTFEYWFRLLEEVPKAPLFPLEEFADLLTVLTKFVGEDEQFIKLTRKTDELLSDRSSGYIAAEKCRDRAMAYYDNRKYLQSIKHFHIAKIKWFSAETIRGSLLAMLVLCDCYQKLGLIYAAKYYAACVASLSIRHDNEEIKYLIPRALFMLSDSCYQGGEWLTFAQILKLALIAHNMYDECPLDLEKHEDLRRVFTYTTIVRTVTKRFEENHALAFDEVFTEWPIDEELKEGIESLSERDSGYWQRVSVEDFWDAAQSELTDRPFSDTGMRRQISWKALGIDWTVEFENDYFTMCISEELVSTLQIILADVAPKDLVLLPTRVKISVYISDESQTDVHEVPSNEISTWRVGFPKSMIMNPDALANMRIDVFTLAVTVLGNCSVLNFEDFKKEMELNFSEGLPAKTFAVRPYAELYAGFLTEDEFRFPNRRSLSPIFPNKEFEALEHEQLKWINSDGPGYSKEKANEILVNRYAAAIKPIMLTLPRLLAKEQFRDAISGLRNEGYLDWEIMVLIANICIDYRVKQLLPLKASPDEKYLKLVKDLMFREEKKNDVEVPAEIFTKDRIDIGKRIQLAAIAVTWGLQLHQQTPDFNALEKLLDIRYHNSVDDIEHDDLFKGV